MAGPGTVSVLAHRAALVLALVIIIGMAAGAIRTVSRCCPGNGLGIVPVTGRTRRVAAMITRVISRAMIEINGQPVVCVVAGVALQSCAKVIARLARRLRAVMAGGTGAAYAVVIETGRYPCLCRVAVIALCAGLDMVGRFARRGTAVMATGTGAR